ncbi:toxin-antitoxin system YwqK family antitoxin [Pararcticibacter amylolyticus]|uniref:toxin-antitoxin system YwqK family antitoxin n=1 Tax=Pararcticibacter amylolyticus TaxID=2173175 RepID=UPI0011B22E2A|nr:hypothetical protein [Pararcticibacter amylolyticus]
MKERLSGFIIFILLGFCFSASGQPEKQTVFERTPDSLYNFFFDSQYYLTDKNCEFYEIKRTCSYNTAFKTFDGRFTDTDTNGNILLTGTYKDGRKQGSFQAFYPGGVLKWQAEFLDDVPVKTWYYFYPDGRPLSILKVENGEVLITDAWDVKGRVTVKNGTGKFSLEDPQFGFNEQGYEAVIYRGSLKDGKPEGTWRILRKFSGSDYETAAIETFSDGKFIAGISQADGNISYKKSRILFAASHPFTNAERFVAKNCNIDEHFNFTIYLSNYLTENFRAELPLGDTERTLELSLEVNKNGQLSGVTLLKGFDDKTADKYLLQILYSIGYWIPSQKAGKVINDTLTVRIDITAENAGKMTFSNVRISRKTGS